jgi:hypothetical protein
MMDGLGSTEDRVKSNHDMCGKESAMMWCYLGKHYVSKNDFTIGERRKHSHVYKEHLHILQARYKEMAKKRKADRELYGEYLKFI